MDALINVVAFRPVFTLSGLRVVWFIYLSNVVVQSYVAVFGIFQTLAQRGISWEAWSPNFIPLIIGIIAQLAVVRLLLEVAGIILSSSRTVR
jgi:hypothetical protein